MEVLSQSVQQPQPLAMLMWQQLMAKHKWRCADQKAKDPVYQMAAALTTSGNVKAVVPVLKARMQLSTMKLRVRTSSLA